MDGTRGALIVASDQYTDPGLRRLRAPASDARALAAVLKDPGIGGFEVRTLLNEPAHLINLAVEEFFADRRPGDLLLVHFSGHGVKDADGELYFAASNTVLGRLGATAVAAEFVSRRMSRSRSRRVVLLLDCCYAGAFERGLVTRAGMEMGIEQQFGGRGRAVITASSAMEYAFEAGELADTLEAPPSVFTSALVQGLDTGDADRDQDGLVGLDEMYDYVYDKVREATPNQTPGKWTFGMEGELYIARRSSPVTTPAPLPPELRQAIDSPLAGVRGGAVQELATVLRGSHVGMALAARLALEQLTDDDSRAVATAATAALGAQAPAPSQPRRPKLTLSDTVIDLGRLPQHGRSPEHRVQISNTGGGNLNAQAATSASWLKLRQADNDIVVAMDTSTPGECEGTVTVNSDGGTATIRVHAHIDPAPPPAPEPAAAVHPKLVPGKRAAARPGPEQDPPLAPASSTPKANAVPAVTTGTAGQPEGWPAARSRQQGQQVADGGQTEPPVSPRLELSATVVDFGRLSLHSKSPERRIRLGNTGGGRLNAQATTQAGWLKLRQDGDEIVVGVDTSTTGEHEDLVTVDSDGGSATISVQAHVVAPDVPTVKDDGVQGGSTSTEVPESTSSASASAAVPATKRADVEQTPGGRHYEGGGRPTTIQPLDSATQRAATTPDVGGMPSKQPRRISTRAWIFGGFSVGVVLIVVLIIIVLANSDKTKSPPARAANSTPAASLTPASTLPFRDDFSSTINGWAVHGGNGASGQYSNGKYLIQLKAINGSSGAAEPSNNMPDPVPSKINIQVSAQLIVGGAQAAYGIGCRYSGPTGNINGYLFVVYDGHFLIDKVTNNNIETLASQNTTAISASGINQLQVACSSAGGQDAVHLVFRVNGQKLGDVTDRTNPVPAGQVALIADRFTGTGNAIEVAFDDFAVTQV